MSSSSPPSRPPGPFADVEAPFKPSEKNTPKDMPVTNRPWLIVLVGVLIAAVILATVLGTVMGIRSKHSSNAGIHQTQISSASAVEISTLAIVNSSALTFILPSEPVYVTTFAWDFVAEWRELIGNASASIVINSITTTSNVTSGRVLHCPVSYLRVFFTSLPRDLRILAQLLQVKGGVLHNDLSPLLYPILSTAIAFETQVDLCEGVSCAHATECTAQECNADIGACGSVWNYSTCTPVVRRGKVFVMDKARAFTAAVRTAVPVGSTFPTLRRWRASGGRSLRQCVLSPRAQVSGSLRLPVHHRRLRKSTIPPSRNLLRLSWWIL
jgi:hypothetical protein